MRKHTKLLLAALTAALLLGAAVGNASARRLELSNTGLRIVWSELTFSSVSTGTGIDAICPVTLEGTFHSRTISKVRGQLIGYITRAILTSSACRFAGGAEHVSILNGTEGTTNTLPWHINYDSFQGNLPNITVVLVTLLKAAFVLTAFGVRCLYEATPTNPAGGDVTIGAGGAVTGLRAQPERSIPKKEGSILCPSGGFFRGTGRVTLLGTETGIIIRLVA